MVNVKMLLFYPVLIIQKYLEDPISEILLKKTLDKGTIISVKALKEKIEFDLQKPKNKTKQDLKLMPK